MPGPGMAIVGVEEVGARVDDGAVGGVGTGGRGRPRGNSALLQVDLAALVFDGRKIDAILRRPRVARATYARSLIGVGCQVASGTARRARTLPSRSKRSKEQRVAGAGR
jgi:hypothetical protein